MVGSVLDRAGAVIDQERRDRQEWPAAAQITHIRHHDIERERYERMLALPTDELRERAAEEIRAELVLSDDLHREAVYRRLAVWLDLDPEDARILARVWDEASAALPVDEARRRFEAECDAVLHGFRFQDFTRFAEFLPWLKSHFGLAMVGHAAQREAEGALSTAA